MVKLLFLAGSTREASLNKKLAVVAAKKAKDLGVDAMFVDLKEFEMPIYNGDLEDRQGLPEGAKKLKKLFVEADGFFIASPEYNSSFSALLKNALDWISRSEDKDEQPLSAYKGKVAALAAVSPGGYGGMRGLVPLRMMLGNIGVTVIPSQMAVPSGFDAFDDKGGLIKEGQQKMLLNLLQEFVSTTKALAR